MSSKPPHYRLRMLREGLRPFRLHFFPRLRSTNDHAVVLRRRGQLFAPAAVLGARQIAGRGRGSNTWWSGPGSITVTFALAVDEHLSPTQVPLAAGLAVRDALAQIAGEPKIALKWPNDVVYGGRKLAGVLCERILRLDLVGVGVNLNVELADLPRSLRGKVASLRAIAGRTFDPSSAVVLLAKHVLRTFSMRRLHPFAVMLRDYAAHHVLNGKRLSVRVDPSARPISGRCEGLDDIGRLIVRDSARLHRITTGHVSIGGET